MNEILQELKIIREEIVELRRELRENREYLERLDAHIDFVETTYSGLRAPLDALTYYCGKGVGALK